jgi:hypothetical protein
VEAPECANLSSNSYSPKKKKENFYNIILSGPLVPAVSIQASMLLQVQELVSCKIPNIREAHVFSTTDGFSLDVFVVDGWATEVNN